MASSSVAVYYHYIAKWRIEEQCSTVVKVMFKSQLCRCLTVTASPKFVSSSAKRYYFTHLPLGVICVLNKLIDI